MADAEGIVPNRLIISGLTPAIDANALAQRLSSFGTVHSLVGVGMLDANGDPRKFAHLTLETTKAKLARCVQAFSGSSWKGAKLRIGEAKPDINERKRVLEHPSSDSPPSKRLKTQTLKDPSSKETKEEKRERKLKLRAKKSLKPKLAGDMTLVSAAKVEKGAPGTQHWKLTADADGVGKTLLRPVKMRPAHPLPEVTVPPTPKLSVGPSVPAKGKASASPSKKSSSLFKPSGSAITAGATTKQKKKKADPTSSIPTRARATVIDPTRYGARHIHMGTSSLPALAPTDGEWIFDEVNARWVKTDASGEVIVSEDVRRPHVVTITSESSLFLPSSSVPKTTVPPPTPNVPISLPDPDPTPSSISRPSTAPAAVPITSRPNVVQSAPSIDPLAAELAHEKSSQLALMKSLLSLGWAVDLDEIVRGGKDGDEDEEDADGREANVVVRREELDEDDDDETEGDEELEAEEDGDEAPGQEGDAPLAPASGSQPTDMAVGLERDQNDDEDAGPRIAHAVFDDASSDSQDDDEEDSEDRARVGTASAPAQPKTLKDMFAPREEEGTFSLFGNLLASGLDLDDIELESGTEETHLQPSASTSTLVPQHTTFTPIPDPSLTPAPAPLRALIGRGGETIELTPGIPLMFAIPPRLREAGSRKGGAKDIFDVCKERGWEGGFWRSSTEEEIRQRWDETKGDLTRQYRKRHREASKKRKRGHGTTIADREAV